MSATTRRVLRPAVILLALGLALAAGLVPAGCGGSPEPPGPTTPPPVRSASPSPTASPSPSSASPAPTRSASRTPSPSRSATASPPPSPTACPTDNVLHAWYYTPNDAHRVPSIPADAKRLLRAYGGSYVGDAYEDVVYLTFDEGYENGHTAQILDELRDADVAAAFFVTGGYIRDNPDLVRRMADEGHVVANHTDGHPSLPSLAGDTAAFRRELTAVEREYRRATGRALARLLRPPKGEYSARSLCLSARLGYTTLFWSFAHRDWLTDDQPPVAETVRRALAGSHPGAVYLLHAVSRSNTLALPAIIAGLRDQGYRLGSPAELLQASR